jgi:hypothetical protein
MANLIKVISFGWIFPHLEDLSKDNNQILLISHIQKMDKDKNKKILIGKDQRLKIQIYKSKFLNFYSLKNKKLT